MTCGRQRGGARGIGQKGFGRLRLRHGAERGHATRGEAAGGARLTPKSVENPPLTCWSHAVTWKKLRPTPQPPWQGGSVCRCSQGLETASVGVWGGPSHGARRRGGGVGRCRHGSGERPGAMARLSARPSKNGPCCADARRARARRIVQASSALAGLGGAPALKTPAGSAPWCSL
jgi:hypothetical protein